MPWGGVTVANSHKMPLLGPGAKRCEKKAMKQFAQSIDAKDVFFETSYARVQVCCRCAPLVQVMSKL